MAVAFVLAGGGSLAASQVGMLRALTEAGISPDLMVGSSAGAINSYCFAEHPTEAGLDRLTGLWCGLRRRDVFPFRLDQILAGLVGRRDGIVPPDRLRAYLRRHVGSADLADTTVPTYLVATDLAAGEPMVFSSGPVVEALMASTAMPGVFPPVRIGDRQYVDGGITADTPIRQAEDAGATVTYVLPSVGPERPTTLRGAVPVLMHAIGHVFGHVVATDVAGADGEVHVLPAPEQGRANPFDFRATARLIDEGYATAKATLAGLRSAVSS
ncbi:MAG TPA: patatin-like phospholipase family protein [Pseudonocardiaceae bacterium]|nr:patatin-like phospholipase family protein [Pseudonocardiaceae bacterium]